MTWEQYRENGHLYFDYVTLSQYQRLRGILLDWRKSKAPVIQFRALWSPTNHAEDWERVGDWWHPRRWGMWRFGISQCQNFHHISFGPFSILVAP